MKKYLLPLIVVLVSAFFTSCEDMIEVDNIVDFQSEDSVFLNTNTTYNALNGAYHHMRFGSFYGGDVWLASELLADNVDGSNFSGDWGAYYTRNTGIFIGFTRAMWFEPYSVTFHANKILENVNDVPGIEQADIDNISGQCYFLRAVSHFELVRLFGQPYGYTADNSHLGIPIRISSDIANVPRGTVGEVYAQIITDLKAAEGLLPTANNGYATSWAAKAMLAKVYFQMNDFTNANTYATDVIDNGGFMLEADLTKRMAEGGNTENIFALVSSNDSKSGDNLLNNYKYSSNSPSVPTSAAAYNFAAQDTADQRFQLWYSILNEGADNQSYAINKYNGLVFFDVPIAHLTEIMLIRAESAAELGDAATALNDINQIRARAGLASLDPSSTPSELITAARNERRIEMISEGNRLHELKRQAVNDSPDLLIRNAPWDCAGLVVQLPDEELSGNSDLQSNPEGGCQ